MGEERAEPDLRTCPRCGKNQLTRVQLTSGLRDVCLSCGYFAAARSDRETDS
jgi:predicted RNA-binding Zn-ribbon protein involved in translation (DUF1610 family)